MRITTTDIVGLNVVEGSRQSDERGFFSKILEEADLVALGGASMPMRQIAISHNAIAGTIRGLHWQAEPLPDGKLVHPIRGRIFDVVVDIRNGSPTFGEWRGFTLDACEDRSLLIAAGLAHGFQAISDHADVLYVIDAPYKAELARGIRYDDPTLGIAWPLPVTIISTRDRDLPDFSR
jgi:dTDP-4-dehydrorhamnose 3,5-epimerase